MPIKEDCVKYSDFKAASSRPEWNKLKFFLAKTLEQLQNYQLLKNQDKSDEATLAKKDLNNLLKQMKTTSQEYKLQSFQDLRMR